MDFEFDPRKNAVNRVKHGIGFEQAKRLWDDPMLLVIPAKNLDEPRYAAIGRIDEKMWTAFYTVRDTRIRLISVRRSRKEEITLYEGQRSRQNV